MVQRPERATVPLDLWASDPQCEEAVARAQRRLDCAVPPEELRAFMAKYGSVSN
jgi:hypothetical protein